MVLDDGASNPCCQINPGGTAEARQLLEILEVGVDERGFEWMRRSPQTRESGIATN